jgi:hypothetical protein
MEVQSMESSLSNLRLAAGIALTGLFLATAGCQSGGGSVLGSVPQQAPVERVTESELRAYCPQVVLRSGTAFYNTFEPGGEGDPAKLIYQASIADVTRSCTYGEGTLTMNVAVAGKVVPGPAGSAGTISMPIRVAVTRLTSEGEEVLYSQLHNYSVAVNGTTGATQFVFNDPNVTFAAPTARNIRVFAGYDEGVTEPATQ